jgi:phenylalanyl-tRNA synthetase beta chain
MKISLEWLNEYVQISESPEKLKQDLTMIGLLVESIEEVRESSVLDIEITSNRPDCLSHIGIAREVAALYRRPFKKPPVCETLSISQERIPYNIEIEDAALCPRYVGLVLDGIRVESSPEWMQRRLEAAGMRPLNNIVDITNYVLLEMGHPLHAFDFDILRKGKIVVGRSVSGAQFKTLDGNDRRLDGDMLMINDGEGPVAIAGVMGGLNSEISMNTTRILLESAYFQPASIRRTSRKLGLSTEASYRFERGADWENTVPAIARACYLIEQLAGGRIAGSIQDVYPQKKDPVRILLHQKNITALLGIEFSSDFVESTLNRLDFITEKSGADVWNVTCPTFRADMELEADLIEELARFYGYQNIPTTVSSSKTVGQHSPVFVLENTIREALCGYGYHEAVNLSFAAEADHVEFSPLEGDRVQVRNPLTEDTQFMRTTLAAGLLRSAKRNFNFGQRHVNLFEIGRVYYLEDGSKPCERNVLGILSTGGLSDQNWTNPGSEYTFFHLKGLVEALLRKLRICSYEIVPADGINWLHDSDAALFKVGQVPLGILGSLALPLEDKYKLRQPVFLAEIDLTKLAQNAFSTITYEPLPKLPSAERDLSFVLNKDVAFQTLKAGILQLQIPELTEIQLIDVYEGDKIPDGKVSLTVRLTFLDQEKTLTIDRVQDFVNRVLSFLNTSYNAGLRSL